MSEKKDEKKPAAVVDNKKPKITQTDKYYKIKADFGYLNSYNYKITKEIGRGGYGVVYKVNHNLFRPSALLVTQIKNMPLRSISIQFRGN